VSRLLRPQTCSRCGKLTRGRVFTVGARYVCDRDACLEAVIRERVSNVGPAMLAELKRRLLAAFTEA
jgi:hypothetical protein